VLVNTTYTMPLNTILAGGLLRALRWPVLVPLLYLTIALWPLVWAMNWKSYLDGSAHKSTDWTSFSGQETRGQLDFAALFTAKQHPGVLAKGILAMLRWDETATLPTITVPTLIITSDHDKLTLPRASEDMRRLIPRSELVVSALLGIPASWSAAWRTTRLSPSSPRGLLPARRPRPIASARWPGASGEAPMARQAPLLGPSVPQGRRLRAAPAI
jgi:pimeloyl-ACP methyl ester carboxylesterase